MRLRTNVKPHSVGSRRHGRTLPLTPSYAHTHIITIRVIIAATHSMKKQGFDSLIKNLPPEFQKNRSWCHIFVTDRQDAAAKLGKAKYPIPSKMKILVHTAVLDISLFQYRPEVLKRATIPSVSRRKLLYNHFGTYLSHDSSVRVR